MTAQLVPFDFMGITAGEVVSKKAVFGCEDREQARLCKARRNEVAGVKGVVNPLVWLVDGKMAQLQFAFSNNFGHYERVKSALSAKYGKPCDVSTEDWANRMGTTLDNTVTTWCFSTGKLVLRQFGSRSTWSDFTYVDDDVKIPEKEPVVDF